MLVFCFFYAMSTGKEPPTFWKVLDHDEGTTSFETSMTTSRQCDIPQNPNLQHNSHLCLGLPSGPFHSGCPERSPLCISLLPHYCHLPCSVFLLFHRANYSGWRALILIFTMQFTLWQNIMIFESVSSNWFRPMDQHKLADDPLSQINGESFPVKYWYM